MIDYQIISISQDYAESLCLAIDSVARERLYLAITQGFPLDRVQGIVQHSIDTSSPFFIAIAGNQVIGWCEISRHFLPLYRHNGTLWMGILPEYRKLGIGAKLVKSSINDAKEKNILRVELDVRETNIAALGLYKKMGFEIEGVRMKNIKIDDLFENTISMALIL